jgi:hypothetical protein
LSQTEEVKAGQRNAERITPDSMGEASLAPIAMRKRPATIVAHTMSSAASAAAGRSAGLNKATVLYIASHSRMTHSTHKTVAKPSVVGSARLSIDKMGRPSDRKVTFLN